MDTIKSKCGAIPKTVLFAGAAAGALAVIAIIVILSVTLTLDSSKDKNTKSAPPVLNSIDPTFICGNGGSINLIGDSFEEDTQVNLISDTGSSYPVTVLFLNSTVVQLQITEGSVPMGFYNISAQNGKFLVNSSIEVEIRSFVFVLYMDPPSSYSGVSLSATVYTSGLNQDPAAVTLFSDQGSFILDSNSTVPNKLNVVIPSGLTQGYWSLQVDAQDGCASTLNKAIYITSTLNISVNFVTPAYAYSGDYTSITIKGTDPTPVNFTSFQQVPTVYISPSNNSLNSLVTKLRATDFADGLTLTAVVPSGLTPTVYNLIIVNPDGSVGVLNNAITIVNTPTPVIYSVSPNSLKTSRTAVVTGANFDTMGGIQMWMNCIQPNSTTILYGNVTVVNGSVTATSVTANFVIGGFKDGTVCTVVVQNSNGASFEFSAISKKASSGNLQGWAGDHSIQVPRRGHVQVGGRPTPSSRFLYVIGGDNGSLASAMSTVEAASMSPFGSLGSWAVYPDSALPCPLTFAGVTVIDNFIYIAGGYNGSNVTNSLLRAQILDPLQTPISTPSLDIDQLSPSNLTGGFWYYQVSAIFGDNDLVNPGGESLPGELVTIRLPDLSGLILSLDWTAVPSAVGYKIYRTPSANMTPEDLQLLAIINNATIRNYVDTGAPTVPGTYPLPSGSLGRWRVFDTPLNTSRYQHAMLSSVNPLNANQHFIYVMGGTDSSNGYLDTYEYLTVNVTSESDQQVSSWTVGASKLSSKRANLGAVLITHSDENSVNSTENWIFMMPGQSSSGNSPNIDNHFLNTSTGDLGTLVINSNLPSGSFSGYCALASSGFIYLFGGKSGPSLQGAAAQICNPSVSSCGSSRIPTLVSGAWNNEGTSMSVQRIYHACSQESPFFFATGGYDGVSVLSSVDRSTQ